MDKILIRAETEEDIGRISEINKAAFQSEERPNPTEHLLVGRLREEGALALSLVAEVEGQVVGHVAFSKVKIDGQDLGWFGLGPIAVEPKLQGRGIGSKLAQAGLAQLRGSGAKGCLVLGSPDYYPRFGFNAQEALIFEGVPQKFFMSLVFSGENPTGKVDYHHAFAAFS